MGSYLTGMPTATSRPFRQETTNSKPPIYSEEFRPQRQLPQLYSEELKPARPKPPQYSEEFKPTRTKQPRHSKESRSYSSKENSTRTHQPPMYSEELKPTRTNPPTYSEEFLQSTTPLNYGSRRKPKPMCGTECNSRPKKRKPQIVPSQSNSDRRKLVGAKNGTAAPSEKPRYSFQYSPDGSPNDGGFVPIPSPFVPNARTARSEEPTAKESRQSPNILGNGNFEILSGGVFPEEETNEIPQGRRVGRTGRTYDGFPFHHQPRFQPFNVQNFQFPAFYPNRHQLPAHPLFFPRGAF